MFRHGNSISAINALLTGALLLACPSFANAQRRGAGASSSVGGGGLSSYSRPDGVDEKDTLKDFHESMALQATSPQIAEFQMLLKATEAAQTSLRTFVQSLPVQSSSTQSAQNEGAAPQAAPHDALDQVLQNAHAENKNFQEGFSPEQKSGLREGARRLAKTDSDLELEQKKLDQALELKAASPEIAAQAENLEKVLAEFYDQQLALGREMSITLSSRQDLAFTLPKVRTVVSVGASKLPVAVSGMLTQIAAQGGQRKFKLELSADLADLQQNIFDILSAKLNTSDTCGQRLAIRQAILTPATPAGLLVVRLHFERWMCTRSFGQPTANELAEADGTVEIKLTASIESPNPSAPTGTSTTTASTPAPGALKIAAAFGRIDAAGMLAEELRSGSLGDDLRDQAAQSLLAAARAASDFKTALPLAVQNSAVLQSVKFQEVGVGGLSLALEGQIEISDQQAGQLASQLNQTLSAQAPAPH